MVKKLCKSDVRSTSVSPRTTFTGESNPSEPRATHRCTFLLYAAQKTVAIPFVLSAYFMVSLRFVFESQHKTAHSVLDVDRVLNLTSRYFLL